MADDCITSTNFLSPLGFRFVLSRTPNLNFHVQSVVFPGVQLGVATMQTPFVPIPREGKLTYDPLSLTFRVSENMEDYLELYNWMTALGAPRDFEQYKTLSDKNRNSPGSKEGLLSDMTLTILTSNYNPNLSVTFYDGFPISISDLSFLTTDSDVNYIEASASFRYLRYEINTL